MAVPVIIMGRSGTGKSTSMRNFKDGEIGLINVMGKPMPFRGHIKSVVTTDYNTVVQAIQNAKVRSIIIDDAGYLITDMFMTRHASAGKGNGVYSLYNDIGDSFYGLVKFIAHMPDPDKIVYIILHEDTDDFGNSKIKTIGKLLDEKVTIEGMVSVLLRSTYADGQYLFQTNGAGIVKSPDGMFDDEYIPNDLALVDRTIRSYWGLKPLEEKEVENEGN